MLDCHFLLPGIFPNSGVHPVSLASPARQADSSLLNHLGSLHHILDACQIYFLKNLQYSQQGITLVTILRFFRPFPLGIQCFRSSVGQFFAVLSGLLLGLLPEAFLIGKSLQGVGWG